MFLLSDQVPAEIASILDSWLGISHIVPEIKDVGISVSRDRELGTCDAVRDPRKVLPPRMCCHLHPCGLKGLLLDVPPNLVLNFCKKNYKLKIGLLHK